MKKTYSLLILILAFFSFTLNLKAISNITINNNKLVPTFDVNTHIYNVFVSKKTEIITINVTPDEGEVVTGGGSISLKKGLNVIEIISYIDEKMISKYVLNITRGDVSADKSIATLSNIKIENHELEFKSDIYSYNIDALEDENRLDIFYETSSPLSSVKLEGDVNLNKERNIINLIVTSGDKKSTKIYTIKVYKELEKSVSKEKKVSLFDGREPSKFELKLIIGGLILLFVIILSVLFYFIFIRKSNSYVVKLKKIKLPKRKKRT